MAAIPHRVRLPALRMYRHIPALREAVKVGAETLGAGHYDALWDAETVLARVI